MKLKDWIKKINNSIYTHYPESLKKIEKFLDMRIIEKFDPLLYSSKSRHNWFKNRKYVEKACIVVDNDKENSWIIGYQKWSQGNNYSYAPVLCYEKAYYFNHEKRITRKRKKPSIIHCKTLIKETSLSKIETNDCVVKAIAVCFNVDYNEAHDFTKKYFRRQNKKGTYDVQTRFMQLARHNITLGNMYISREKISIHKAYKLYGKYVDRVNTINTFCKENPDGTYFVLIFNHALAIKDGIVIDNGVTQIKPCSRIQAAFKIIEK